MTSPAQDAKNKHGNCVFWYGLHLSNCYIIQWMLICGEMSDYKINWYRMSTILCKYKLISVLTQLLKLDISPTLKNLSDTRR
jgi:hypothetical protein